MSFLLISASHLADVSGKSGGALPPHAPHGSSEQSAEEVVRAAHCGERDVLLPMSKPAYGWRRAEQMDGLRSETNLQTPSNAKRSKDQKIAKAKPRHALATALAQYQELMSPECVEVRTRHPGGTSY